MKSKDTERFIKMNFWGDAVNVAMQAVEYSEKDARQNAIIAHSSLCKFRVGDKKCRLTDDHSPCNQIADCRIKKEFINAYDNQ